MLPPEQWEDLEKEPKLNHPVVALLLIQVQMETAMAMAMAIQVMAILVTAIAAMVTIAMAILAIHPAFPLLRPLNSLLVKQLIIASVLNDLQQQKILSTIELLPHILLYLTLTHVRNPTRPLILPQPPLAAQKNHHLNLYYPLLMNLLL